MEELLQKYLGKCFKVDFEGFRASGNSMLLRKEGSYFGILQEYKGVWNTDKTYIVCRTGDNNMETICFEEFLDCIKSSQVSEVTLEEFTIATVQ